MKSPWVFLVGLFLLAACSPKQVQIQPENTASLPITPAVERETATVSPLPPSPTPSLTPSLKPSATEYTTITPTIPPPSPTIISATLAAEATIAALGTICETPASKESTEISSDRNWIAIVCKGKGDVIDSHLRVISLHDDKDWTIHYADYARFDGYYDSRNMVHPFHWSRDGRYLYTVSPSLMDGCCWLGGSWLLVRLNLENGAQSAIVNYTNTYVPAVNFSISPSDRYLLYIPQDDRNKLFTLDLLTYKTSVIKLDFKNLGAGYTAMSNNDEKIILVLMEYPESPDAFDWGSLKFSLVLIDLISGSQQKLISGMESDRFLIPVSWQDDDHVLLTRDKQYRLLNILTGELTETPAP